MWRYGDCVAKSDMHAMLMLPISTTICDLFTVIRRKERDRADVK